MASKESLEKKVEKVYFLIHPAYTSLCGSSTPPYLFERWQKKIDSMGKNEILFVLAASSYRDYKKRGTGNKGILKYTKKLGKRGFAFFNVPSSEKIASLLKARKLVINPKTVESEAFGEYYQLCVSAYASDYNKKLKFRKPTYINKELSYDLKGFDFLDGLKKDPHITQTK